MFQKPGHKCTYRCCEHGGIGCVLRWGVVAACARTLLPARGAPRMKRSARTRLPTAVTCGTLALAAPAGVSILAVSAPSGTSSRDSTHHHLSVLVGPRVLVLFSPPLIIGIVFSTFFAVLLGSRPLRE